MWLDKQVDLAGNSILQVTVKNLYGRPPEALLNFRSSLVWKEIMRANLVNKPMRCDKGFRYFKGSSRESPLKVRPEGCFGKEQYMVRRVLGKRPLEVRMEQKGVDGDTLDDARFFFYE